MATWIISGKVEFDIEREVTAETEEEAIEKVKESIYENYGCNCYDMWGHKLDEDDEEEIDEGFHEVEGYMVHDAWDV